MPPRQSNGSEMIPVPIFIDTGDDPAALDRWKREHPDWITAGAMERAAEAEPQSDDAEDGSAKQDDSPGQR